MEFKKLSEYFEKLEAISSRLSLIEILSDLFKHITSPDEIEKVCYLVQGRIAPFFEATEIGMAEKTVASAVARSLDIDREEVLKVNSKVGDMGLAVQKLNQVLSIKYKVLSIDDVFSVLKEIAGTSGDGT